MQSAILSEIEKRHGKRCDAEMSIAEMDPPNLLSNESKKDFDAIYKEKREEYLDASLMATRDMKILLRTIYLLVDEIGEDRVKKQLDKALSEFPVAHAIQQIINEREVREAEAREKAAKSDKRQGEVEGQQKLGMEDGRLKVKDDGSEAEPASECVSKRLIELSVDYDESLKIAYANLDPDVLLNAKALAEAEAWDSAGVVLGDYYMSITDVQTALLLKKLVIDDLYSTIRPVPVLNGPRPMLALTGPTLDDAVDVEVVQDGMTHETEETQAENAPDAESEAEKDETWDEPQRREPEPEQSVAEDEPAPPKPKGKGGRKKKGAI